jgi:ribosome recycling factor
MINSIDGSLRIGNSPARFALVILLSLLLQGCGGPRAMLSRSPQLTGLEITPQASSIALGLTAQFKATGKFSDGSSVDETKSALWTSSNGGVASIDSTGFATSLSVGSTMMTATVEGISSSVNITVSKAAIASIAVDPSASSIALGSTTQLKATGTYTDHSTQDVTNIVIWGSSEPNIVVVSSAGLAASKSIGNVSITATSGSVNASCQLTVSQAALVSISVGQDRSTVPLGVTAQFTAQGVYTDGSTRDLTSSVSWSSSPLGVVNVNTAGLATGLKVGTATVNATSGSITGARALTVSAALLSAIAVNSNKSTMPLGTTLQMTATGTYSDGSSHDLTSSVSWSSSPLGVVNVNTSGLATGLKIGTATVNATSGTITGAQTLTVSTALLTSIAVTSDKATMPLGTAQQITATGTYTDGSTHDLTSSVSWSSSPLGLVNINTSGLATGLKVGTATVNARSGTITGTRTLTVSAALLTSIAVTSDNATMPLGTVQQMTATGTYTDGSSRDLTSSVSWSSVSDQIVSVSSGGVAQARAMGSTAVSATASAIRGSAALTVSSPALASISISPTSPTILLGSSLQLGAIGSFTDGSTQDLTNSALWSVDNASVVNLSSTGNATAQQVGSTSVEATLSSIQGSTIIVIEPIAATSYFITGPGMTDTTFRFTNPGSDEPKLCAMTYVFDQDQQMAECCGCVISQDGLRTLSLNRDLISNPLTGTAPVTGSVLLVTADYVSNPSCNASSITPDGMAIAWATHVQTPTPSTSVVSEETLSQTPLSATLSSALQAQCQFIQQLGSGQGICSCGTGH